MAAINTATATIAGAKVAAPARYAIAAPIIAPPLKAQQVLQAFGLLLGFEISSIILSFSATKSLPCYFSSSFNLPNLYKIFEVHSKYCPTDCTCSFSASIVTPSLKCSLKVS
ncbi:hypothetical protein [Wolbachia endosymbiont (group A) of Dendrolimus pini]|uniref:hypothetical protein n=1 Tax=Wolbachia endosymbiont (group A) of Dendrolimus pini TaxID=3066171 RepID=UPI0031331BEE